MYNGTKHGIANMGFSGLRSLEVRFNICNGRQERLPGRQAGNPQSLTSHKTKEKPNTENKTYAHFE